MEKLVVENVGSGYGGMDLAGIMALVNSNKGMSPEALMAMCKDKGMGGGGDLFVLILLLLLLGGGNGGGLLGGGNGNAAGVAAANQNFDTNVLLRAVDGNAADIRALSQQLNCDFNSLKECCCTVKNGIDSLAGEVRSTSKDVINAIQAGNCQLSRQLADCCCSIEKQILQQTNTINNGFSQVGFQQSQDKCDILHTIKADGDATRSLIRDNEFSRLREENVALKLQVSQSAQTQAIEAFIDSKIGANLGRAAQ